MNERLVDVGGEESWVGVPVHQCVDLQLGVFKRVRRRVLHLPVDHLSNSGIQTHLGGNLMKFSEEEKNEALKFKFSENKPETRTCSVPQIGRRHMQNFWRRALTHQANNLDFTFALPL